MECEMSHSFVCCYQLSTSYLAKALFVLCFNVELTRSHLQIKSTELLNR